jgi:hypothetical protein
MTSEKSAFHLLGKCYYYSLVLNTLALITIGVYQFIIRNSNTIKGYEFIANFLEAYSMLFVFSTIYLSVCMILSLLAALCFHHSKNSNLIFIVVVANLFCFPLGTFISIFTLYILKKLNRSFH